MKMINAASGLVAVILAGCAATNAMPPQTLFGGKYTNAVAVLDQTGCDVHAMNKCDYSDVIVAFSAGRQVGGARFTQGPQGAWRDTDRLAHLEASVARNGSTPVIRIERIDTEPACANTVSAPVNQVSKLVVPACGQYPEIRATWRTVSRLERLSERWSTNLGLLLSAVGGGELP